LIPSRDPATCYIIPFPPITASSTGSRPMVYQNGHVTANNLLFTTDFNEMFIKFKSSSIFSESYLKACCEE
jgi:hypothetical protein